MWTRPAALKVFVQHLYDVDIRTKMLVGASKIVINFKRLSAQFSVVCKHRHALNDCVVSIVHLPIRSTSESRSTA